MIIKKIELRNIRSYEEEIINFPEGSSVLAGDIGTGKTSVLLAIEFALFGLQPGQRGASLLRNGKNNGSVLLEIEIEGKNIIIERGLKRGKSISQSYSKINVDGEEQEMSVTELKNKVLSLLNYPHEFVKKTNLLFRFTVYTPQEEMKQIILETSETRLNILRHIFGIDKYKRIRENTDIFTRKLREDIRGYEGQIKDLEDIRKKLQLQEKYFDSLNKKIEILTKELQERKEDRIKAEQEVSDVVKKIEEKENYEKEIEKTKIMLIGKKELTSSIEDEKKVLLDEIEKTRKIKFSEEEIEKLQEEIKNKEIEKEDKNKKYFEISSKINSLNSKISNDKKLKEQISDLKLCPTCLQNVSDEYKKNILRKFEQELEKNQKEITKLEEDKIIYTKEIDKAKEATLKLEKNLNELKLYQIKLQEVKDKEKKLENLENRKTSTQKDITLLQKQISTLRESVSLLKKYENIYELKKKGLENFLEKEKKKEINLATVEKEKELILKNIEEIKLEMEKKEKIKTKLIEITELEDWLSSSFLSLISFTEKNIMLKLREEFSKLFNEWFNILVPEIFTVRLDEDFTPLIEQQDYQLNYTYLSGGERTAIALAYRLALNQVINSLLSRIKTRDLVILDEPTDGFSEQQLDKMRDVLNELKVRQLIIVSHEVKIESFVENIIKFRKQGGITKIES